MRIVRIASRLLALGVSCSVWSPPAAVAMPEFARKYHLSCAACHAAVPRLNKFGEHFADSNMKLPHWKDGTVPAGDERLALPGFPPVAVRAQAYAQVRSGESVDPITGDTVDASTDFQAPYLIKLLSSAPLSEHLSWLS